jgi:hypothetical protein
MGVGSGLTVWGTGAEEISLSLVLAEEACGSWVCRATDEVGEAGEAAANAPWGCVEGPEEAVCPPPGVPVPLPPPDSSRAMRLGPFAPFPPVPSQVPKAARATAWISRAQSTETRS